MLQSLTDASLSVRLCASILSGAMISNAVTLDKPSRRVEGTNMFGAIAMQWTKAEFSVTCDPGQQDLEVIHGFLSRSYWAKGISKETVKRSLDGSLCFALRHNDKQVGFARVISDFATVAYLGDVFVLEEYRGRALSKWLMECVSSHPNLQGLRRWILATFDAHGLYEKYGFTALRTPHLFMERHNPNVYTHDAQQAVAADHAKPHSD